MKNTILFIAFTGLILSANAQDTLKLKTINTYYGDVVGGSYYRIGELDGAVLNADTLSYFAPEIFVVNISNDTFSADAMCEFTMYFSLYADTGLLWEDYSISPLFPVGDFSPNDTTSFGLLFRFSNLINSIEGDGIAFEQISYWKIITGISYTSEDGIYSDSLFYAGADTATFRVVRGNVGIAETLRTMSLPQIFPNPAQSQFTVTNTENTDIQLFNTLGQEVFRTHSTEESTVVSVNSLPQGVYMLKVLREDGSFSVHKVVKQ
ncbi:MAG: T9SS type A sorting domain-containing protein [Lentimicrobiaceae bacterium]|nr:T9SS type A sorting domain-containing protein [Lentimicrobiaceae bacterium]